MKVCSLCATLSLLFIIYTLDFSAEWEDIESFSISESDEDERMPFSRTSSVAHSTEEPVTRYTVKRRVLDNSEIKESRARKKTTRKQPKASRVGLDAEKYAERVTSPLGTCFLRLSLAIDC